MTEKKRFLIIDSNALIHRAFHALPPLTTKKGELINAVYGFLLVFFKAIREFQPEYVIATFDLPTPTFRHQEFEGYKSKRPPTPEGLRQQIPIIKEILKAFNVPILEKEGFEADDVIGTLSTQTKAPGIENIILSGDLDVLQLIDENTEVYTLRKGLKDTAFYDEKAVLERYGILPAQLIDFKALRGDPSDNIPGVLGIGEKTALSLIKEFGSLENLYQEITNKAERAEKIKPAVKEKLINFKEQAFLSKMLVVIRKDVPIDLSFEKCQWKDYDRERARKILQEFEFYSLIEKIP